MGALIVRFEGYSLIKGCWVLRVGFRVGFPQKAESRYTGGLGGGGGRGDLKAGGLPLFPSLGLSVRRAPKNWEECFGV